MKYIVFYDGNCGFCNSWVHYIAKNDSKKQIFFSALQSEYGQNFLNDRGLNQTEFDSVILWEIGIAYYKKSSAIFRLAEILRGKFYLISLGRFFPEFIRNLVYDLIAKNRFKLKNNTCIIPSLEIKKQFLN